MKLTKKLAVALHRRFWNWMANETEKRQRIVQKREYPLFKRRYILSRCWCCEYTQGDCKKCPIVWHIKKKFLGKCQCESAEYDEWQDARNARDWREAARIARVIAQLPETEENELDKSILRQE